MVIVERSGASRTFFTALTELMRGFLGCEEEGEGVVGSSLSATLVEECLR